MLGLIQMAPGAFDLVFDDGSDDMAVATLVYAALCTDVRAPAGRVAAPLDQRGWWADPAVGSGLWYVRRQPLGSAARHEALAMVNAALASRAPALIDVVVTGLPAAGNVSGVFLQVTGFHNGRKFLVDIPL